VYVRDVADRYRWVVLAAGTLAQASFSAVAVGLPALAPALRADYGLSIGQTGIVLGAVGIGMLPTLLAWGLLADRTGERAVIAGGLAAAALVLAATAETVGFGPLTLLLILAGAFGASVNAASGRVVMGWFGPHERGLALGIRQTAVPIGGAASAAALPWLASAGGTHLAFLALAGGCFASAGVGGLLLRDAPGREPSPTSGRVGSVTHDRTMWLLGGGSALFLTAQIAILGYCVLFLHEHRGLSSHAAAAVLAGINVLGIGARIAAGRWSDRSGERIRPIRTIGLLLSGGMAVVAVLVDAPLGVLVPALVVAGVLGLAWNGLSFTAAAETAGHARSGAALGLQQTLLGVLAAIAPPGLAAIVAASSWRAAFAVAALGPLLGATALRAVPEPATTRRSGRRRGTSAIPPAAR
jgi:sugar phosphate permease